MKINKNISKPFLVFFVLSSLMWLLITLSKEYVTQVSLNISYDALPQDKKLQKEPEKEIQILVKGTGFKILSTRFFNHQVQLKTNQMIKENDKKFYLLLKNQKLNVQKQLVKGLQLENFLTDTIYFDIGNLVSKKLPVFPNIKINYKIGFDEFKPIQVSPDSILVSGSKDEIDTLTSLRLQPLILDNISSNFSKKVSINLPTDLSNIKLNTKEVVVKGFVEKYTEASFIVPFTVENKPQNVRLTTFPKEIKVICKVDVPRFKNVSENSFKVVCDYEFSLKNGFNYLVPKIVLQPKFVKHVRVIPNQIEYLIHK